MSIRFALAAFAVVGVAASAYADDFSAANGLQVNARVFNDFPGSKLTIDGTDQPAPITYARAGLGDYHVNEEFAQFSIGNFANKHVAYLSGNGGSSPLNLHVGQSWQLDFDIRITAPAGQPRKEGVLQIENPRPALGFTDEGHILVASDGEVAVFGGAMPFTGFGGSTYTLGTTAHLMLKYLAPGTADPVLGAYQLVFTDAVTGVHDSGIKVWGVETDGTKGFNDGTHIGFAVQNQRNPTIADESDFLFSKITIVPAPGSVALLGLGGLIAGRRRR